MKKVLLITALLFFASTAVSLACSGSCRTDLSTSGKMSIESGAFIDKATVTKKGNITDGSQAVAGQKASGSYNAPKGGAGITAGVGLTSVYATNNKNSATSAGIAGNIAGAGVVGKNSCAKIKGSGELATVAVKGGGVAATSGSYKYQAQGSAVLGAGVTAGISHASTTKNTVTSGAAAVTASGVTALGSGSTF